MAYSYKLGGLFGTYFIISLKILHFWMVFGKVKGFKGGLNWFIITQRP